MYEKISFFYKKGYWKEEQLMHAVEKGIITQQQAREIMEGGSDAEM